MTIEHLVDTYLDWAAQSDAPPELGERLRAMESLFCCYLPRSVGHKPLGASDRAKIISFAWRCADLYNALRSPFQAPPSGDGGGLFHELWEVHSLALGTPIEALKRSCREAFKGALLTLFPGVQDFIVTEANVEAAMAQEGSS